MSLSKKLSAVIIDDMDLARANLKADLELHADDIEIIGEASSVVSGLKLLKQSTPDIVFLDIELGDGLGFDILELIGDGFSANVIFTTASNEYAIKAFQVAAVDYLLKPIDPDLLANAILKIKQGVSQSGEQINILKDQLSNVNLQRIALHTMDKIVITDIEDIVRCESSGNYTIFYLRSGDKVMVTRTLKEYDNLLAPMKFIRTHQSHLVNAKLIKEYVKTEGGYLVMQDDSHVPVSVRKRVEVVQYLDKL